MEITFTSFDEGFLAASWNWLQNDELRMLIDAAPVTKEQQKAWFEQLTDRTDYLIWGVNCDHQRIGVCGLKHITANVAEYWGYIGEKKYWGKGIGTVMLRFAEQQACKKKLTKLHLRVLKLNNAAIRLYQKQHYQILTETSAMLIMQKQLNTV